MKYTRIASLWRYAYEDPLAVSVTFEPSTRHECTWRFGRDLIRDALTARQVGRVGLGDVQFAIDHVGPLGNKPGSMEMILLEKSAQTSHLFIPTASLRYFLIDSEVVVPVGLESDLVLANMGNDISTMSKPPGPNLPDSNF